MSVLKELINANNSLSQDKPITSARMPYFKDVRDAYKTMLNALDALEDVEDLILKSQDARSAEDHTKISAIIHNIANETNHLLSIG